MNKLIRGPVPSGAFDRILRYIFDDGETVEEDYMDHDECRIVQVAYLDAQSAHEMNEMFMRSSADLGALLGTKVSDLEGYWMIEATRSNCNGLYWDQVYEMNKCHEVAETITVTKWKPIDAEQASTESVPAQPASQK